MKFNSKQLRYHASNEPHRYRAVLYDQRALRRLRNAFWGGVDLHCFGYSASREAMNYAEEH
jgi:hypothetical protein